MAGLRYVPALDGVRAVAVTGVLLFHAGVGWATGGFLGVDAFFVLSGYLITTLLVAERERTGRIDLLGFWGRRARRLLPALVLVVATVVAAGRFLLSPADAAGLRSDAWATLLYANNWQLIFKGGDYFAVTSASPLEHTWSLAIEEQFYLLWPIALSALLLLRRARSAVLTVCLAGAGASAAAFVALHDPLNPARSYYGTDTRGGSLLLGAALAVVLSGDGVVFAIRRSRLARTTLQLLALAASAVVFWALTDLTGEDPALYRGALPAFALATALILMHVVVLPGGAAARLLSLPPLPWLGRISYGVYLWHWPVFLAINSGRSGLAGWRLLLLRCCATVAIAAASYVLLERPIRARVWLRRPQLAITGAVTGLTACAVLVPIVLSGSSVGAAPFQVPAAETEQAASSQPTVRNPTHPVSALAPAARHPRQQPGTTLLTVPTRHDRSGPLVVDVFGDSIAWTLVRYLPSNGALDIRDHTMLGCGITRAAPYRYFGQTYPRVWPPCRTWTRSWTAAITQDDPDVAFILVGRWETMDRVLNGRWQHVGEPAFDAYLRSRLLAAIKIAGSLGARVILATEPYNQRGEQPNGSLFPEDIPARVNAWNRLLRAVAAEQHLTVADFGSRVSPGGKFTWTVHGVQVRSDGVHLTPQGVQQWVAPWLFRVLLRSAPR